MKKIPLRTCIVTREVHPKSELLRIVNVGEDLIYDPSGKIDGHGAYILKDKKALTLLKKNPKILERIYKKSDYSTLFDELEKAIEK